MEALQADRDKTAAELSAVSRSGVIDGATAGAGTRSATDCGGRYDLTTRQQMSGSSHDTLAQSQAPGVNKFSGAIPVEPLAPSTNDLGNRTSASPFVRPEDYTIPAERPQTASSSAKFADWKSPARTAKQPPGGRSDMWNIFG